MIKFKTLFVLLFSAVVIVFISGCENHIYEESGLKIADGIVMTAEHSEYDGSCHEIKLLINNSTDADCCFGEDFKLLRMYNGQWEYVTAESESFAEIAHLVQSNTEVSWTARLDNSFKLPLKPGVYRIRKEIDGSGVIYAEFTIK